MENQERTFIATYSWTGTIEVEATDAEHAEKIVWDSVLAHGWGGLAARWGIWDGRCSLLLAGDGARRCRRRALPAPTGRGE